MSGLTVMMALMMPALPGGTQATESGLEPAVLASIDSMLSSQYPADEPGAAVVATLDGEVVLRAAYGMAHLELEVPMRPEMAFCLASVTKPFTAMTTMILVENGELLLEEEVTEYFPNLVHAQGVTVEHLLSHTSGIADAGATPNYMRDYIHQEVTPDDLIATIQDEPLQFQPGERFDYCNSNYAILARLLELASGQPWEDLLREHIFEPAGMTSSCYGGHLRVVPGAVTGYSRTEDRWERSRFLSFTRGYGLGGLFSSVDDLAIWSDAFLGGGLMDVETRERMFEPYLLADGEESSYALGFQVEEVNGHRSIQHGGGIFGWRTMILILPDDEIFVSVLTNRDDPDNPVGGIATRISQILLGEAG